SVPGCKLDRVFAEVERGCARSVEGQCAQPMPETDRATALLNNLQCRIHEGTRKPFACDQRMARAAADCDGFPQYGRRESGRGFPWLCVEGRAQQRVEQALVDRSLAHEQ